MLAIQTIILHPLILLNQISTSTMESYRQRHILIHTANLEAETAAVPAAEPEPPIETPILETRVALERSSSEDDLIGTEAETTEAEAVDHSNLGEMYFSPRIEELEAEWEMSLMREEHAYLWREAEAEVEAEMGRISPIPWGTDEVSVRSCGGKPYEEIVLEQLKIRNFDEEERHEDEEEICSICLEDLYRGTIAALDCRHEFHVGCITRWLVGCKNFCPLCRATALPRGMALDVWGIPLDVTSIIPVPLPRYTFRRS